MEHTFRAMGTTVCVIGPDGSDPCAFGQAAESVEVLFEEQEARFSRFRPHSELTLVNLATGGSIEVSEDFAEVVGLALEARDRTGGLFDPTILPALEEAGYDRDFDEVIARANREGGAERWQDHRRTRGEPSSSRPRGEGRPGSLRPQVTLRGHRLDLPDGTTLDLGGIAKGWTVDRAAEAASTVLGWAIVGAGGDMRLAGSTPPAGLPIGIEDTTGTGHALTLHLRSGAVATSSTLKRSWSEGVHHIIDPRTWLPSATGFVQATAWAPTCAEAEVLAKWVLLGGAAAFDHAHAAAIWASGDIVMNLEAA